MPHGNVPYSYTNKNLKCNGDPVYGCNYGGKRIEFGLGSATETEGQRWYRGAWRNEKRSAFEQALYVVSHERFHSTPLNQRLPSENQLPGGYNKETDANKRAMEILKLYRGR